MTRQADFRRGLSDEFVEELADGRFADLLHAAKGQQLDVHIRENYIDIYADGGRVLKLTEGGRDGYGAIIHREYLAEGVDKRLPPDPSGDLEWNWPADEAFVTAYVAELTQIAVNARANALARGKVERTVEQRMIWASYSNASPVVFIDRQVQAPGDHRAKADMVGLMRPKHGERFLLVELKQDLTKDMRKLVEKVGEYYEMLVVGRRLRGDIAASYRHVVSQKRALGLLADDVHFPQEAPLVECLIVAYASTLTDRALQLLRSAARVSPMAPKLTLLREGQYTLPPPEKWVPLS